MRGVLRIVLAAAAVLVLGPAAALAQEGQIAGTVRDTSGALMPGVTVEVTSPALIEKVRTASTDASGQYRITALPVGTYKVTFSLEGFTRQERDDVVLTSGFTAPINGTLSVGQLAETVVVSGVTPIVDVQNAREVISFQGEQLAELPSSRNINSLLDADPRHLQQLPADHRVRRAGRVRRRRRRLLQPRPRGLQRRRHRRHQPPAGPRARGRRRGQHQRRAADRRADRRLHRGRGQCPGSEHSGVGRAGRVGDRRRLHQHRAPDRRQPLRRRLQRDVHHGVVVRQEHRRVPQHHRAAAAGERGSRRVGGVRRPDQARSPVVLLGGARPGDSQAAGRHRFLAEPPRGQVGLQLPAGSRPAARRIQEHVEEHQRPHHLAGDEQEQVQLQLGRTGLLPGPLPRCRVGLHLAGILVVGRVAAEPPAAGLVDQPADEQDPARRRPERGAAAGTSTNAHREYTNPRSIPARQRAR